MRSPREPVLLWKSGTTLGTISLWDSDLSRTSPKGNSVSIPVSWKSRCLPKGNIVNFHYYPRKLGYAHLQNSIPRKSLSFNIVEGIPMKVLFPFWAFFIFNILNLLWKQWKALISVITRMHQTDFQKQRNTVKQKANFSKALNM